MRKLTDIEQNAVNFLSRVVSYCPGTDARGLDGATTAEIRKVLDALVRKKRATADATDDGPVYSLTAQGRDDAS